MSSQRIEISDTLAAGSGERLLFIAGPDLIESEAHALRMAEALADLAARKSFPLVFKASFDKANRTSVDSARGPGLEEGLRVLARVKERTGLPLTTDFHLPEQARTVAHVFDRLQVPAFLCRQTDVLLAAGRTGRAVNVKKGQFLAPADARHVADKVRSTGNDNVMITERGTTFGYHNLVVDFRTPARLRSMGLPVCFDATHSVQLPGAGEGRSGGEREFIRHLARAAVAVGVDALFFEVHDDPDRALCDGPNQIPLDAFPALVDSLLELERAAHPDSSP
jgi:2-dehydro-3-deoxyphosphooctonate aldolase (KDO 8-P synthase)